MSKRKQEIINEPPTVFSQIKEAPKLRKMSEKKQEIINEPPTVFSQIREGITLRKAPELKKQKIEYTPNQFSSLMSLSPIDIIKSRRTAFDETSSDEEDWGAGRFSKKRTNYGRKNTHKRNK